MKTRYEYEVHVENGSVIKGIKTREGAREEKRDWKTLCGYEAKIIQRKYTLSEQKEVR